MNSPCKVRALVVGFAHHFAPLPVRPVGGICLVRNVIPGQVLILNPLLQLSISTDGAHLGGLAGRVVIRLDRSRESVFLDGRALRHHGNRAEPQRKPQ